MPLTRELSLILSSALTSFARNKIRTFLTSLGIMIGVLSVVMLIALGLGLKNYIQNQFESMGTNLIVIMPGNSFSEEGGLQSMGAGMFGGTEFEVKDVTLLENLPLLEYVVPIYYKFNPVSYNDDREMGYLMGANEDFFPAINLELVAGRYFTHADVHKNEPKVVLGFTIAEKLFTTPERALDKTLDIGNDHFTIIGVAKKKGDMEMDSGVFMPYTATFNSFNTDKKFLMIYTGVADKANLESAKQQIETALLKRYDTDDFSVIEQNEMLDTVNQIFSVINGVLIAIGSISLLVGGIGIMNIMYASVTERTKEIGIRRAIGATQPDILRQFLTEAVILSVFGGLFGLILSAIICFLVHPFFPIALNLTAVLIAFGVSTFIGIFFGVSPAHRAAHLPPIEAIRYE